MAIRIRKSNGKTIALCAVESDVKDGDIYLDDDIHYALTIKFMNDWNLLDSENEIVQLMEKEKVRDAKEEIEKYFLQQEKC